MPAEDNKEKRRRMAEEVRKKVFSLPAEELEKKKEAVINRLFDFANFMESKIAMLYSPGDELEFDIDPVFKKGLKIDKVMTFPFFGDKKDDIRFYKVDNLKQHLKKSDHGILMPDRDKCREIPEDYIDIAIIPGMAFDEKGGRIPSDNGLYDRLIAKLPITTRKIALGFEEQIVPQIPMESKKKYVDMIITDERVIYKI